MTVSWDWWTLAAMNRRLSKRFRNLPARSFRRSVIAVPDRSQRQRKVAVRSESVDAAIWSICDIMRRGNVASALQYVPELTWILFLRILDETEDREEQEADAVGASYNSSLKKPYRWKDWAAPLERQDAKPNKRKEIEDESSGAFMKFVNTELIPYLKKLKERGGATPRQKVISEIMSGVEKVRIDTEKNLLDVLDKVHEITNENIDPTHVFALSQIYEGLLLKMGEKGSDAGQFFTPREVIRAMVRAIDPKIGETVYDPCCGTGGFLAQAAEHMRAEGRQENLRRRDLEAKARDVLGTGEGEPHLPDRPCELDSSRYRPSEYLARQRTDETRGVRRVVYWRPDTIRRRAHQSAIRREGERRGPDALCLSHKRDAGPFPAAHHRGVEGGRTLRHGHRRGCAVPHERGCVRQDQTQTDRRVRSLVRAVVTWRRLQYRLVPV